MRFPSLKLWQWGLLGASGAALVYAATKGVSYVTDKAGWAKMVFDETAAAVPGLSVPARALVVAHAAYESGWGVAGSGAKHTNGTNLFNLTAGSAWHGTHVLVANADLSYASAYCARVGRPMNVSTPKGMACRIDQDWRSYPSVRAGIADYWSFLGPGQNGGRYVVARTALQNADVPNFALELYKAGYYDYPPAAYAAELALTLTAVKTALSLS